ncbi:MAG: c-type cytochrome domain-containing protein, partial [Terracidiphilus sp.]
MKRHIILACICGVTASAALIPGDDVIASGPAPAVDPTSQQFYSARVVEILQNNCLDCHDETAKGGLRLDSYSGIKKGGEDGAVIVPGDPDASMLIQAIRRQGDLKMPPKRTLDPAAVADLVAWVKAGAAGSDPAPSSSSPSGSAPASTAPSASPQPATLAAPAASATSTSSLPAVDADFFENKVRPIFANSCYDCHDETAKGGLRLDTKAGFEKGGKNGAEVIAGDPEKSRLIAAVEQTGELKMPKGSGKLKAEDIATLVAWVKAGANWPASASAPLGTTATT